VVCEAGCEEWLLLRQESGALSRSRSLSLSLPILGACCCWATDSARQGSKKSFRPFWSPVERSYAIERGPCGVSVWSAPGSLSLALLLALGSGRAAKQERGSGPSFPSRALSPADLLALARRPAPYILPLATLLLTAPLPFPPPQPLLLPLLYPFLATTLEMSDDGGSHKGDKSASSRPVLSAATSTPSGDANHSSKHGAFASSPKSSRDRSMSLNVAEIPPRKTSSLLQQKPELEQTELASELLALEDMSLREHYKVSEALFEVRQVLKELEVRI